MMIREWTIEEAEGGFIVSYSKRSSEESNFSRRVFADSAALLNFLHNELVGSN